MKRSDLVSLVREVMQELDEANAVGSGGASFTPCKGATYATPFAFGKSNRAVKTLKRQGYKQVSRPKRPSHTKGFDYL